MSINAVHIKFGSMKRNDIPLPTIICCSGIRIREINALCFNYVGMVSYGVSLSLCYVQSLCYGVQVKESYFRSL